ncbi:hypothetical protein N0V90_008573 [Kalmusia sp. IMI 367209]|nr:hypothetical protein N0V90_008573 [Kalmusia sp. IMI 367209]
MSHRQSCNRCRQQKAELRFLVASDAQKQAWIVFTARSNRRSAQTSVRRGTDPGPSSLNDTTWFEQGLNGPLYPGVPSLSVGTDFSDLVGQFTNLDDSGTVAGFNCWDANIQPFSPTSLDSLAAPSAADTAPTCISTAPSTLDGREDNEDVVDDDKDPTNALSSQLTSLSQRAARATRNIVRPGRAPLTVSSPEVNEALEDTNTLIRIMNDITTSDREVVSLDSTTTDCGLAFSALASHQHLVALFRAICDAIHGTLQSKKEQQQLSNRQQSDMGPSSVAQFVMVLQLLMHLINRMDRSLFQNTSSTWQSSRPSTSSQNSGHTTPVTPTMFNNHATDATQSDAASGGSSPGGGLLFLVQDIVGTIPNEHEKLRQMILKLQTEMEHSELH